MDRVEMEHLERVTTICDNRGKLITKQATRIIELVDKIADLEAQAIAQARTIAEQAVIIREHQAADVIAVEALRSQAAEITRLKEQRD